MIDIFMKMKLCNGKEEMGVDVSTFSRCIGVSLFIDEKKGGNPQNFAKRIAFRLTEHESNRKAFLRLIPQFPVALRLASPPAAFPHPEPCPMRNHNKVPLDLIQSG